MNQFDDFLKEDFDGEGPDPESRALLKRLAELEDARPPVDLTDRIMRRVAAEKRETAAGVVPLFKRWGPVAAAVLLVVAAIPFLLGQFGPQPSEMAENPADPPTVTAQRPDTAPAPERQPENPSQEETPVTVATVPNRISSAGYAPPEKVAAYFETWDSDLAGSMETYSTHASETESLVANLPEETFGYYESPYEDPLSALVGF